MESGLEIYLDVYTTQSDCSLTREEIDPRISLLSYGLFIEPFSITGTVEIGRFNQIVETRLRLRLTRNHGPYWT